VTFRLLPRELHSEQITETKGPPLLVESRADNNSSGQKLRVRSGEAVLKRLVQVKGPSRRTALIEKIGLCVNDRPRPVTTAAIISQIIAVKLSRKCSHPALLVTVPRATVRVHDSSNMSRITGRFRLSATNQGLTSNLSKSRPKSDPETAAILLCAEREGAAGAVHRAPHSSPALHGGCSGSLRGGQAVAHEHLLQAQTRMPGLQVTRRNPKLKTLKSRTMRWPRS
jgi:hypothetical protein